MSGRITVGQLTRLAVERQLRDLKTPPPGYHFDQAIANQFIDFAEMFHHVKGRWTTSTVVLEGWQCFAFCTLMGWVDAEGFRRFRQGYVEVGRKNTKSTMMGILGLWGLTLDGEEGPEVYSAAVDRGQAMWIYDSAKMMARKHPKFQSELGVKTYGQVNAGHIASIPNNGRFEPLSREAGGNHDGKNGHFIFLDEFHAHKTRAMYNTMATSTGARKQPLMMITTTAGESMAGPCYPFRQYVEQVLRGEEENETLFGLIYAPDPDDRWDDVSTWVKANPNLGVSVEMAALESLAKQARVNTLDRFNFETKHLNRWLQSRAGWLDLDWIEQTRRPELTWDRFAGMDCWIGVDLSSKVDMTAIAYLFKDAEHYYTLARYYLPASTIEESTQHRAWLADNWLTQAGDAAIEHEVIKRQLLQDLKTYRVRSVGYDPNKMGQLMLDMRKNGAKAVEFTQTASNFTEPMWEVEALLKDGKLLHGGNPITEWMLGNTTAKQDARGMIYPRKEKAADKIDGTVALLIAKARETIDGQKSSGSWVDFGSGTIELGQ